MKTITLVLASLTVVLSGCTSNQASEENMVANMERVDNHDGLIAHYKDNLKEAPESEEITQQLAKVYFDKGDLESAKFYADHLLDSGVRNWQLLQLRGQIHNKEGEDKLAVNRYQRSIELGNSSADIYVMLGVSYCMLDQFEQAKGAFNKARLKGYNDVVIKNNLAVVDLAQSNYMEVVTLLAPVYKENPSNEKVKANLAIALFKLGDVHQARAVLEGSFTDAQMMEISRTLYQ